MLFCQRKLLTVLELFFSLLKVMVLTSKILENYIPSYLILISKLKLPLLRFFTDTLYTYSLLYNNACIIIKLHWAKSVNLAGYSVPLWERNHIFTSVVFFQQNLVPWSLVSPKRMFLSSTKATTNMAIYFQPSKSSLIARLTTISVIHRALFLCVPEFVLHNGTRWRRRGWGRIKNANRKDTSSPRSQYAFFPSS